MRKAKLFFIVLLIILSFNILHCRITWKILDKRIVDYSDLKPPFYRGYPNDMLYFVYWDLQREDTGEVFQAFTVWKYHYKFIDRGDRVSIIWDQGPLDWHTIFTYDPRFFEPEKVKRVYMNVALMEKIE